MKIMFFKNHRTNQGIILVDTLMGLAIIGIFMTTLLSSISVGFMGLRLSQDTAIAESLVRSQFESIKGQSYMAAGGYSSVAPPSGYSIMTGVETISGVDPNSMQRVVVTVYHNSRAIRVVRDFKLNR